ncbi:hypothetical protein B0H13DRAFT_1898565 [Mycena leptocephala]|nr:hypothetical protein B0H13DRAFT_1898565 [Mycena leptocephala]
MPMAMTDGGRVRYFSLNREEIALKLTFDLPASLTGDEFIRADPNIFSVLRAPFPIAVVVDVRRHNQPSVNGAICVRNREHDQENANAREVFEDIAQDPGIWRGAEREVDERREDGEALQPLHCLRLLFLDVYVIGDIELRHIHAFILPSKGNKFEPGRSPMSERLQMSGHDPKNFNFSGPKDLEAIAPTSLLPDHDILRSPVKTASIAETTFQVSELTYKLRRRWPAS